jgi:biotin carboxyl carrier protein
MKFLWRGKAWEVRLDGTRVSVTPEGGKPLSGEAAGAERVAVARDRGGVWVSLDGMTAYLRYVTGSGAGQASADEVRSPMTGTVVSVGVKPGDDVAAGRVLAVVSAMKMEFRIEAPGPGRVEAVECRAGEKVELGAILVRLSSRPAPPPL